MTPESIRAIQQGQQVAAPTAGQTNTQLAVRKDVDYAEVVQWLLAHPGATHAEIGTAYGRPAGWFSTILVTEEFQQALDPFRGAVRNPSVTASIEERMQSMLVRSLDIIQTKMSAGGGDAMLALEAAKLSTKALGMGQAGRDNKPVEAASTLETLADRLTSLVANKRGGAIGSVPAASAADIVDVPSRQVPDGNTAGLVAD